MTINVQVGGDTVVAMNDAQLAALNSILAETPTINRYDGDKVEEKKRIKLEAVLTIKTRSFTVA